MHKITYVLIFLTGFFSCTTPIDNDADQFLVEDVDSKITENTMLAIDKQLKSKPNDVALVVKKALKCRDINDFECTLNFAAKAYRLDSTNVDARNIYAWTLINKEPKSLEDIADAQRHFEYVLSKNPQNPEAYVNLANTYSLTGDFKSSFQYINEGLKIDKNYRDAYILKGSNYRLMGDTTLAASSFETALQVDPTWVEGYLNVADFYVEIGNPIALEYYQTAKDLKPKTHQNKLRAEYGIAKTNQDLGNFEEALQGYRNLAKMEERFVYSYYNAAYIKQYNQNDVDSAVYFYNKSLDIDPNFLEGWHNIGLAYLQQNRKSDAARAFANALRIDPEYQPTKDAVEKGLK